MPANLFTWSVVGSSCSGDKLIGHVDHTINLVYNIVNITKNNKNLET